MVEFIVSKEPVEYDDALRLMNERVAGIHDGSMDEAVWFLEHPSLYTAGTSAKAEDLLDARFPVYETGRGGEHTYHGPGQRVAYVMLDLKARAQQQCLSRERGNLDGGQEDPRLRGESIKGNAVPDIKKYVWQLEEWIIQTLAEFGVKGERRCGRVGIWVSSPHPPSLHSGTLSHGDSERGEGVKEEKIAAIGVRVRHWITLHGIAINVAPDLSHFGGIVPCGISEYGVTSLQALGVDVGMEEVGAVLKRKFGGVF